ncbi:DMT family transporter [Thalassospira sp. UBA1131]|uniref:DMT family transporter n=1 Tax=Thalassospira sp. UBA1131 TaxID=1947672 RepID=UPI0025DB1E5F|nr:DMT family transporter [Thalassospira sp. UBA1131]
MPSKIVPIVLVIMSAFLFTAMIIIPRFAPSGTSAFEVSFIRFVSASLLLVPFYLIRRHKFSKPALKPWVYISRAMLAVTMLSLSVFAINNAPVVVVQAILMGNGAFTVVLASLLAKERPAKFDLLALLLIIGGGVVTVINEDQSLRAVTISSDQILGVGAAVLAAIAWGGEVLMVRSIAKNDHSLRLVTYVSVLGIVVTFPIAEAYGGLDLSWELFATLSLMGIFAALGQLCSATALARISASEATPYRYSSVLFAVGLGYVVFGEMPSRHEWLGSLIIISGILISTWARFCRPVKNVSST